MAVAGLHQPTEVQLSFFTDRMYAIVTGVAVFDLSFGRVSTVGLNLWVFDGGWAFLIASLYLAALAAIAIDPDVESSNLVAAGLGFVFWVGRTAAFAELWLTDRPDLRSAVLERSAWVVIHILWHIRAARAIALRQTIMKIERHHRDH